jgi:hypothetical protein
MFTFIGVVWSDSVDLAHHYALVVRLTEHGNAAFPFDPSLGEMNVYPRLAHQLAASAGRWYASPMMGMQALAVLSLVLIWAGLAWLVAGLPRRMAAIAAAAMAALLALNHYVLHMPLHGDELVGNFFFPQLFGQTLCIGVLLVSLRLERQAVPAWLRYALLVPVVYLMTGVHLLPALILLTMMGFLVGSELLMQWRRQEPGLAVAGAVGAGLLLSALGALVSHPGFEAMREISKQNGGIALPHLDSTAALMWYSAAIALVSAALLWHWMRRPRAPQWLALKYVGLYGLAVSGLCLAQGVALRFGFASEYAVRKYAFSLDTVALIELALLPALLPFLQTRDTATSRAGRWYATLQHCALPAALTALACVAIADKPAVYQTRQMVALERDVVALRERLGAAPEGKFNYVVGAGGGTAVVEYMMSIGHFHISRMENSNAASLLFQRAVDNWPAVGGIVTAENGGYDRAPECRLGAPRGGLVALDGGCLLRRAGAATRIAFTDANKVFPCTLSGFSGREGGGAWTAAPQATLRCPLAQVNGKAPGSVEITASAFRGDVAGQRAVLTVDGMPARRATFGGAGSQTLSLPLGATAAREIVIQLALPDAVSPRQLGLSGDTRKLGLFVQAVEFKERAL